MVDLRQLEPVAADLLYMKVSVRGYAEGANPPG